MLSGTRVVSVEVNGATICREDVVKVARNGHSFTGKVKNIIENEGAPAHLRYQVVVLPFGHTNSPDAMRPVSIHHIVKQEN